MSIKDYCYLAAILVVAVGLIWWHESSVREGEKIAQVNELKAVVAQRLKDDANAKATTDSLQAELAGLRNTPPPAVGVRCTTSRLPASKPATRDSGSPASTGSVPSLPSGTTEQPDIGAELQRLARAADIVSARDRACLTWAKGL